jgi:nucleotide-binding universal stress UspA family protein
MTPTVVVGYDQTRHSERALDEAAAEAVRRGASLTVVHAFTQVPSASPPGGQPTAEDPARAAAQRIADQGVSRARQRRPGLEVQSHVQAGDAPAVLAGLAQDADLLVVGHRGRGCTAGLLPCAVAVQTVLAATCPVLVVRGGQESRGTVIAGVDLEEPAEGILAVAFDEASRRRTGVKAISVREKFWPRVYAGGAAEDLRMASIEAEENAELALDSLLRPWQAAYPDVHVRRELADGAAGVVLTAASSHSDLVVVGGHRHHGSPSDRRHIGPTVHELLLDADCPVAVVPRKDGSRRDGQAAARVTAEDPSRAAETLSAGSP